MQLMFWLKFCGGFVFVNHESILSTIFDFDFEAKTGILHLLAINNISSPAREELANICSPLLTITSCLLFRLYPRPTTAGE